MNNNEWELIFGILCLISSLILLYLEIKDWRQTDKENFSIKSFQIEIIGGAVIFMMIGIAGIYRYFN